MKGGKIYLSELSDLYLRYWLIFEENSEIGKFTVVRQPEGTWITDKLEGVLCFKDVRRIECVQDLTGKVKERLKGKGEIEIKVENNFLKMFVSVGEVGKLEVVSVKGDLSEFDYWNMIGDIQICYDKSKEREAENRGNINESENKRRKTKERVETVKIKGKKEVNELLEHSLDILNDSKQKIARKLGLVMEQKVVLEEDECSSKSVYSLDDL